MGSCLKSKLIDRRLYGLLTLESGLSALREAHHPFDRIVSGARSRTQGATS